MLLMPAIIANLRLRQIVPAPVYPGMVPIDRRRFLKGTTAALAIAAREGVARGYAATAPYKVDVQIR